MEVGILTQSCLNIPTYLYHPHLRPMVGNEKEGLPSKGGVVTHNYILEEDEVPGDLHQPIKRGVYCGRIRDTPSRITDELLLEGVRVLPYGQFS